ncbi:MAG: hypothetical protein HWE24_18040 [Oceanospirillaceae bacterium]|nr:hypothetical protein [Oceanospirillaceae bacterium]
MRSLKIILAFWSTLLISGGVISYFLKEEPYYGEINIESKVSGLQLIVNERNIIKLPKDTVYKYKITSKYGTADFGSHEVVFQKKINASQELYRRLTIHFTKDELKHKKAKSIILLDDNHDMTKEEVYGGEHIKLSLRENSDFLMRRTGLIEAVKLQHNNASSFSKDEKFIYILTRSSTILHSLKNNENQDAEFLEIYDVNDYSFIGEVPLPYEKQFFYKYRTMANNQHYIYIGDDEGNVIFYDKSTLLTSPKIHTITTGKEAQVSQIKTYNEHLIFIVDDGTAHIYKDNRLLYVIDTKLYRPKEYNQLQDKRFNHLFDFILHKGYLYISSDISSIYVFKLNDEKPEFHHVITNFDINKENIPEPTDINSMFIYGQNKLYYSKEYKGLSISDIDTFELIQMNKGLFPKKTSYNKFFNDYYDDTKSTDIVKMFPIDHQLIFTEFKKGIYVYDFTLEKITHKFDGVIDNQADIIEGKSGEILSLGSNGNLYIWRMPGLN